MFSYEKSNFEYIDYKDFPKIFFGVEYPCEMITDKKESDFVFTFLENAPFSVKKIAHQSAGLFCNQHLLHGFLFDVPQEMKNFVDGISNSWFDSSVIAKQSLDDILQYRTQLQEQSFDCNESYFDFEESFYPIDCKNEYIQRLTNQNKIDEESILNFVDLKGNIFKRLSFNSCLRLVILTYNSD